MTDGGTGFTPFSPMHGLCVAVFVAAVVAAVAAGRRFGGDEPRVRRRVVIALWVFIAVYNAYYLWPSRFEWGVSLPLQMCDLALFVSPLALVGVRWARAVLYFCGLLLSSQGLISPTVEVGPGFARFWMFWISHAVIVGAAIYDLAVLRFRPTLRDLGVAFGGSVGYVLAMVELNRRTGFNYGFVGESTPEAPTLVDHLGPWPWRVVWMVMIGGAVQGAAWAVWPLEARWKRGRTDGASRR